MTITQPRIKQAESPAQRLGGLLATLERSHASGDQDAVRSLNMLINGMQSKVAPDFWQANVVPRLNRLFDF